MARPAFTPDEAQRRTLRELSALADRLDVADAKLTELITEAQRQGVPIEHIARYAKVTKKTVYRRLGHPMR